MATTKQHKEAQKALRLIKRIGRMWEGYYELKAKYGDLQDSMSDEGKEEFTRISDGMTLNDSLFGDLGA